MANYNVIAKWRELAGTYLTDDKRGRYDPTLFVADVEVRENADGKRWLYRSSGVEELKAATREEADAKVAEFASRPDVRLLAPGIETNMVDVLPRRQDNPPADVLDGTAAIYNREPAGPIDG